MKSPKNWTMAKLERETRRLSGVTGSNTETRAALVALYGAPSK